MLSLVVMQLAVCMQRFYAFNSMEGAKFESKCLMLQV